MWPGAWAPSTIESTPAAARRRADLRDREDERGRRGDVADEDGPRARPDRAGELLRLGVDERRAGELPGRSSAPYSCRVVSTSSPGSSRSERITAFRPAVAFGTKTRSSARAPTNAASAARTSARQLGEAAREEIRRVALELALQPW